MSVMSTEPYSSGATVKSSARFVNAAGALTDPAAVTVSIQYGTGEWQAGTAVKDATGLYHCEVATAGWTGPGFQQVAVQWTGTTGGVVTDEFYDRFLIQPDGSAAADATGP